MAEATIHRAADILIREEVITEAHILIHQVWEVQEVIVQDQVDRDIPEVTDRHLRHRDHQDHQDRQDTIELIFIIMHRETQADPAADAEPYLLP